MVKFTARRSIPELVAPARPTPRETKILSDVDDCYDLRVYSFVIKFFHCRPGGHPTTTPAKAVKAALAESLVYYHPIAGRLREVPGNKLVVDCTGEGAVFVEASADAGLEEFGHPPLRPPYPCVEELLCDAGDTTVVVGKPLFFIQVTELIGGGFVLGFQVCHSIFDGFGMIQFIKSIGDLARGEVQPAVLPVWERHILMARTPPRITDIDPAYSPVLTGSEYDVNRIVNDVMLSTAVESMVHKYLLFSPRDITHLRGYIVPSLLTKPATAFELLTAVMWRCQTIALGYEVDTKVRLIFTLNARGRWKHDLPIPREYYGNTLVYTIAEITVGDLCGKPLGHIVELIRKAKTDMLLERMRSMVDMMALLRGRPTLPAQQVYWVTDNSHIGGDTVDFGWAEWVGGEMPVPKLSSFHTRCKDIHGEESITVSVLLPGLVMEKFASEIASWLNKDNGGNYFTPSSL
ncbi:hypothetical protein CFC21_107599 [Triticum aestivum]|uniref:Uncharacterized protein n=2 Tax=Triticum aestivum TaxID=4565 RepID=A0A9R1MGE7_WHEAT|nr:hypothetical protein CFC21_107599 [Triticum aestivum]